MRDTTRDVGRTRSAEWFDRDGVRGFIHRAFTKGSGYTPEDMGRPLTGIAQTWSELNHYNSHLRGIAEAGKRGVWQAGGWPMEFPTISLGEVVVKPTTCYFFRQISPLALLRVHTLFRCNSAPGPS